MKNKPDNQKIIAYLLGSLPAAEAEVFDELSFTDDDFAQNLAAAENDLIDGYLHDELTGETLSQFEAFYLASPRRREKIEFAKSIQAIARRERTEKEAERAAAGFFARLKVRRLRLAFALGALPIVISCAMLFLVRQQKPEIVTQNSNAPVNTRDAQNQPEAAAIPNANLPQNSEQVNPSKTPTNTNSRNQTPPAEKPTATPTTQPPKIALASLVLSPPLRNSQIANFPIPEGTTDIAVRLELESNDFPAYRVALTDEAGSSLRQFAGLRARGNSIDVRFPARILKSGVYTFEVSGVKNGAPEIIANYAFRVVIK